MIHRFMPLVVPVIVLLCEANIARFAAGRRWSVLHGDPDDEDDDDDNDDNVLSTTDTWKYIYMQEVFSFKFAVCMEYN